jgi:hypothetical protein
MCRHVSDLYTHGRRCCGAHCSSCPRWPTRYRRPTPLSRCSIDCRCVRVLRVCVCVCVCGRVYHALCVILHTHTQNLYFMKHEIFRGLDANSTTLPDVSALRNHIQETATCVLRVCCCCACVRADGVCSHGDTPQRTGQALQQVLG